MDYFVRVMHGLGIITVAASTLEAVADKGLQGLGEVRFQHAPLAPLFPGVPLSLGALEQMPQMPNKHIPVLVQ